MATKRPIVTEYHGGACRMRLAHATTPKAAARAAFRRINDGDFYSAFIYNGKRWVATVERRNHIVALTVHFPRSFT